LDAAWRGFVAALAVITADGVILMQVLDAKWADVV
jgi:hypothetical protein